MGKQGLTLARESHHVLSRPLFLHHDDRGRRHPSGPKYRGIRVHKVREQYWLGE